MKPYQSFCLRSASRKPSSHCIHLLATGMHIACPYDMQPCLELISPELTSPELISQELGCLHSNTHLAVSVNWHSLCSAYRGVPLCMPASLSVNAVYANVEQDTRGSCRSCLYEAEERDKCRCLRSEHVRSPICAYRNEKALPGAGAQPHPFVGTEAATHTSQTALFHTEPHRLPGTLEQSLGRTGWPGL